MVGADSQLWLLQEQAKEMLRSSSEKRAEQLAEQRAALAATADAEGDGHAAADAEALGLEVSCRLSDTFTFPSATAVCFLLLVCAVAAL